MKSFYATFCAIFMVLTSFAQSLNKYEYVIIPAQYDFLKSENQYQLNELTSFLIKNEGFKTVYDSAARSAEFTNDQCAGLTAEVENKSGVFNTKLIVIFRDCNNAIVWKSKEGKSKQKDYKKGYHEALRKALLSLKDENYSFNGKKEDADIAKTVVETEVEETPKIEKKSTPIIEEVKTKEVISEKVEEVKPPKVIKENKDLVKVKEEEEVVEIAQESEKVADEIVEVKPGNLLYAQATLDGFQLVNNVPSVVFVMVKSSKENVFILKNLNGIIYKDVGRWFAEYYQDNKLIREAIQIKF